MNSVDYTLHVALEHDKTRDDSQHPARQQRAATVLCTYIDVYMYRASATGHEHGLLLKKHVSNSVARTSRPR
jgi:hypothetical protein